MVKEKRNHPPNCRVSRREIWEQHLTVQQPQSQAWGSLCPSTWLVAPWGPPHITWGGRGAQLQASCHPQALAAAHWVPGQGCWGPASSSWFQVLEPEGCCPRDTRASPAVLPMTSALRGRGTGDKTGVGLAWGCFFKGLQKINSLKG